eukprot:1161624-Pelagomonas_calceolata.AAC.10
MPALRHAGLPEVMVVVAVAVCQLVRVGWRGWVRSRRGEVLGRRGRATLGAGGGGGAVGCKGRVTTCRVERVGGGGCSGPQIQTVG